MGRIERPRPIASRMSTIRTERPSVRFALSAIGVVRARSSMRSEYSARLVQIFWPRTMKWSRSRRAVVLREDLSVPLVGSVTPNACSRRRPAAISGRWRRFWASEAVPQDRPHCVHLGVTGAAIATRALDFLQHRGRSGERQTCPAVFFGDQDREPAGLGERFDKFARIGHPAGEVAPIFARKACAELRDCLAYFRVVLLCRHNRARLNGGLLSRQSALPTMTLAIVQISRISIAGRPFYRGVADHTARSTLSATMSTIAFPAKRARRVV